jgi:hypothetical protein
MMWWVLFSITTRIGLKKPAPTWPRVSPNLGAKGEGARNGTNFGWTPGDAARNQRSVHVSYCDGHFRPSSTNGPIGRFVFPFLPLQSSLNSPLLATVISSATGRSLHGISRILCTLLGLISTPLSPKSFIFIGFKSVMYLKYFEIINKS